MVNDGDPVVKAVGVFMRQKEHMGYGGGARKGRSEMEGGTELRLALPAAVRSWICFLSAIKSHRIVFKQREVQFELHSLRITLAAVWRMD